MPLLRLEGGCHCGAVRFVVKTDTREALDCNCSICTKKGFLHVIVPEERFTLLCGEDALVTYRFGTGVAAHRFCRVCGVQPFYRPRSHPEGISVNARALDEVAEQGLAAWTITPFDGRNWEENVASIRD